MAKWPPKWVVEVGRSVTGLKLGGLVEGMCPNVLTKEFFRSVKGAWQNGRQSGLFGEG